MTCERCDGREFVMKPGEGPVLCPCCQTGPLPNYEVMHRLSTFTTSVAEALRREAAYESLPMHVKHGL